MPARTQLDICGALGGEEIFITGATGFIGKVLVEKLLWSVPGIGKLHLLVRPDGERDASVRLREDLLTAPLFGRLRALHGDLWESWVAGRIEVVAGDVAESRFGLSTERYERLTHTIDRVVSCAATVTFDEQLDRALEVNVRGAQRTLELARDAGSVPLLHVSTCFVSGRRQGPIAERVEAPELGADATLEATLAALEQARDEARQQPDPARALVVAGGLAAERYGFHDVYTLTKALAERFVARDREAVPVAIVRPAIVESAAAEPIAGWIEAVRVADPMLVAYGRGQSRDFAGTPEATLEIVPVDHVVNAMIAALARLPDGGSRTPRQGKEAVRVYQLASSRNPVTLRRLVRAARAGFARAPLHDARDRPIRVPAPRFFEPRRFERRLDAARRRARALTRGLRLVGLTSAARRSHATQRKLEYFSRLFEIYRPYLGHAASYEDRETRELWQLLTDTGREAFPFEITALDWDAYVARIHIPGLLRFALRAEHGAPPPATDDPVARGHARGEFPAANATSLFELLATSAAADPETVALQTCRQGRWLRYTYGQAVTASANIAARLAAQFGIGPGDRVVLWGSASPEWVLTSFAIHRLGAVTVPIDPQWPAAEVEQAAAFTAAKLVCAAPALEPGLSACALPRVLLSAPFVPDPDVGLLPGAERPAATLAAEDLATILFTSGTTVAPRAVPLTHGNILANVRSLVPVMASSRERLLSVLPIHHVFEFTVGLLVPLVGGGTISYLAELKPEEIRWMMGATRPTMLVAVPRLLELLHNGIRQNVAAGGRWLGLLFKVLFAASSLTGGRHGRRLFGKVHERFGGSLKRIATGGSALRPSLGRSFQLMGFEVAEGYGMTETSPVLSVNPWGAIRLGSVGRPVAGVDIEIRPAAATDGTASPADNGSVCGEIWVRGANVMTGYYRNDEASKAALRDGWLHTGDLGALDRDGYLRIAGRSKEVIVTSAGKNVYPEEVELRYRGLTGVEELVVLGLPDNGHGERVTAVLVPRKGVTPDEIEAVREAVATRSAAIPSYQRVTRLEFWHGDLPKTTTMKVKRGELRARLLAGDLPPAPAARPHLVPDPVPAPTSAAPTTEQAWVLATLARLTRSRVGALHADIRLGELGMDSLARVELLAELEARFGLRLDDAQAAALSRVQDLFDLLPGAPSGRRAVAPRGGAATHRTSTTGC